MQLAGAMLIMHFNILITETQPAHTCISGWLCVSKLSDEVICGLSLSQAIYNNSCLFLQFIRAYACFQIIDLKHMPTCHICFNPISHVLLYTCCVTILNS